MRRRRPAGEKVSCWPAPETPQNLNAHCCNLGLSEQDEDDIVAFLQDAD